MMTFVTLKDLWQCSFKKSNNKWPKLLLTKTNTRHQEITELFLNTKLTRKPGYIKQGSLTKDNERKKQKGWPFAVINKYPERDMLFQIKPGVATYNQAVQQKKKMEKICDSMPKSINLSEIKRKLRKTFTVKLSSE